jgi:hypothetical protein
MARFKAAQAMGVVNEVLQAWKPGIAIAGAVGAGAALAQIGGEVVKAVPAVRAFALKGSVQEAACDLAGGAILDAAALYAARLAWGPNSMHRLAPYVIGGTVLSAAAPMLQPYLSRAIVGAASMTARMLPTPSGVPPPAGTGMRALPGGRARMPGGAVDLI